MRTERVAVPGQPVELVVDLWPGTGSPAVLAVHGLASNARLWDGMAESLARMGHPVAAVDLRGHGRSSKPDDGYDFGTVCEDIVAVIAALAKDDPAWERPVAVGQSWGGNLVMELGYLHPGCVRGVVGVDGGTIELSRRFATWDECAAALAPPEMRGMPAGRFEAVVRAAHRDWPESGIRGTLANMEVQPDGTVAPWLTRERHMAILAELYRHRPSTRYAEMAVPVLLVPAGGRDPGGWDPGGWGEAKRLSVEEALAAIPKAGAHWFPSADHDVHAQHPVELAEVVHAATVDGFFGGGP